MFVEHSVRGEDEIETAADRQRTWIKDRKTSGRPRYSFRSARAAIIAAFRSTDAGRQRRGEQGHRRALASRSVGSRGPAPSTVTSRAAVQRQTSFEHLCTSRRITWPVAGASPDLDREIAPTVGEKVTHFAVRARGLLVLKQPIQVATPNLAELFRLCVRPKLAAHLHQGSATTAVT